MTTNFAENVLARFSFSYIALWKPDFNEQKNLERLV